MAPDSIGTWWREDTKRQCDNLTTQLYEVEEVEKLIWVFCQQHTTAALSVMRWKSIWGHWSVKMSSKVVKKLCIL